MKSRKPSVDSSVSDKTPVQFYGKRVMIRDVSDPRNVNIVGVLHPDNGELSCRLDFLDQGVAKTTYFDPDALRVKEVDGKYTLLTAERSLETVSVHGVAGALKRLDLYRRGVRVHNTVYPANHI